MVAPLVAAGGAWIVAHIGTIIIGTAIVIGTAYTIYSAQRSTTEFRSQRELSEKWRKEDTEYLADQANTNLILAVIGIAISVFSIYIMYRRSQ